MGMIECTNMTAEEAKVWEAAIHMFGFTMIVLIVTGATLIGTYWGHKHRPVRNDATGDVFDQGR
jgi:hypothetical protein